MRARRALARQQPGIGIESRSDIRDRQRVPHLDAVMGEHGTRKEGDSSSSSARTEGSSLDTSRSKSMPANLQSSQPRSDQEP